MVEVRAYAESDLAGLAALMTDLGSPTSIEDMQIRMRRISESPNYFTFVAWLEHAIVGMIGLRMQYSYVSNDLKTQVSSLVVRDGLQGRGIGKALLAHAEAYAVQQGSHFVYVNSGIKEERTNAHAFYKKRGYEVTGYRFAKKLNH
ncbi:ribosomal protein S18 acetylase RimI-like enzyme [Paenibacillus taihuensis]|uniref:Ribosomal protein S18 acetylase RimI-like enzyme n=1 Tax=Paenibacillus taihuensis TaxID=1156355 RepID=A0A3D9SJM2_9BACL|nr:GNAT family N-acetyltransferase [Paenibacillus taihuensis]REE94560.1 ribosomal protein S18 acetylase RimI-like enzyme [Paenibacillus taihuensis]